MEVHEHAIGGFQGFRAQAPLANVAKHFQGDAVHAITHGHDAEVGSMGNDSRDQHGHGVLPLGHLPGEGPQFSHEAALIIDILQEPLDASAPENRSLTTTISAGRLTTTQPPPRRSCLRRFRDR